METPPLARRKLCHHQAAFVDFGNTSACAEKTSGKVKATDKGQKHLRLRGENLA